MRDFLRKIGFEFDDNELNPIIHLLAGAQKQRLSEKKTRTEAVTRTTAIVALAQITPLIAVRLQSAGLDWQNFRTSIGLSDEIVPLEVHDVELHGDFKTALGQFANKHRGPLRPTPAVLATAIVEMVAEDRGQGLLGERLEAFNTDVAMLPIKFPEPVEEGVSNFRYEENIRPVRHIAWFCQYRPDDSVTQWTKNAQSKAIIWWKTNKNGLPKDLMPGDPVIYWRSIRQDHKDDRGGLVGTGHIISRELRKDSNGDNRFPTMVHEFYEQDALHRDNVIAATGIDRTVWQGAVLDLPPDQALKLNIYLRKRGRQPIFPELDEDTRPRSSDFDDAQVRVRRDAAEVDHDALGRAPLAISLAWNFHEIWCAEQGYDPYPRRDSIDEVAGFVAHIDAPWGGGKTSFANLIMRTLDPDIDDRVPEFLRRLYPDRNDMSGLFMPAAHHLRQLADSSGAYRWDARARRPWIVVPFNAWLHQHVEPPWWCFYQTIRKTCFRAIRRKGIPIVHQNDDGTYRTYRPDWFDRYSLWIMLWLRETGWRLTNTKVLFQFAVFAFSLGVGLLLWKIGAIDNVRNQPALSTSTGVGLIVAFLTGAGSFITAIITVVADALAPGRNLIGEQIKLGSGDPLTRFRKHFAWMMRAVGRPVLVVVDDLDRCRPEFIVELVRGLQTILMSSRVVYLILGDRKWIEQAFESQHEDMSEIDVGPEHTFGGRFAEKAIQLSFVLPALADRQDGYVREVLLGWSNRSDGTTSRSLARKSLAEAGTVEQIDKSGSVLESDQNSAETEQADWTLGHAIREEVVLQRAAKKVEVQEAIRHRLQPLAAHLPSNPRHIKRIINAISIYQDSILLTEGSVEKAAVGKKRWRELVIGVILMMGFPRSWSILADSPRLADYLVGKIEEDPTCTDAENFKGLNAIQAKEKLEVLRANKPLIDLLRNTRLSEHLDGDPVMTTIDSDVINWLNKILPIHA